MPRKQLQGGFMEENGIRASLSDHSYFGAGSYAVMQFDDHQIHEYREIEALRCLTRDFCFPPTAEYEIVQENGKVLFCIFAKEMPDTPVLEWEFPLPSEDTDEVYNAFMGATVLWDCRQCANDDDPTNCALGVGGPGKCPGFTSR